MSIRFHPDPSTLLSYAAGALDESHALVIASHLDWCPDCRRVIADGELIGGLLLDRIEAQDLKAGAQTRVMQALEKVGQPGITLPLGGPDPGDIVLPRPLLRVLPAPLDELPWRRIAKGVSLYNVKLSPEAQGQFRIWRLAPGKETPEHGHGGTEITMILKGAYADRIGTFARGDVEDLGDDIEHQPIATDAEECICMIASDKPTKFKNLLPRLLQPILRI